MLPWRGIRAQRASDRYLRLCSQCVGTVESFDTGAAEFAPCLVGDGDGDQGGALGGQDWA